MQRHPRACIVLSCRISSTIFGANALTLRCLIRSTASSRSASCSPSLAQSMHLQPWQSSLAAKHSQYLWHIRHVSEFEMFVCKVSTHNLRQRDFLQEHILTFESRSSPPGASPKPGVAGTVEGCRRTLIYTKNQLTVLSQQYSKQHTAGSWNQCMQELFPK